jgi:UDP-N-acetylglucosamine transferase subunit ALG13
MRRAVLSQEVAAQGTTYREQRLIIQWGSAGNSANPVGSKEFFRHGCEDFSPLRYTAV